MSRKKQDSGEAGGLFQRVCSRLDIPPDLFNGIFVEMRGRTNVVVHGCREILLYTPEEVRLRLRGCIICVRGSGLYCTAYHTGTADIDGRIISVSFGDGEEDKC